MSAVAAAAAYAAEALWHLEDALDRHDVVLDEQDENELHRLLRRWAHDTERKIGRELTRARRGVAVNPDAVLAISTVAMVVSIGAYVLGIREQRRIERARRERQRRTPPLDESRVDEARERLRRDGAWW